MPRIAVWIFAIAVAGCAADATSPTDQQGSQPIAPAPRPMAPTDGATLTAEPTFQWSPPVSAIVEVCNDAACSDVAATFTGAHGTVTASGLDAGDYFWRIARAKTGTPWSVTHGFALELPWAKRAGGPGGIDSFPEEAGRAITTLDDGDLIVGGQFVGTADFGGTSYTSLGGTDGFVARLDARDGHVVWLRTIAGAGDEEVQAVAASPNGGVIVSGAVGHSDVTFGEDHYVTGRADAQIYVAAYREDGSILWVDSAYAPNNTYMDARGIGITDNGIIYVTGDFGTQAQFGDQTIEGTPVGSMFVARYFANGPLDWVQAIGPGLANTAVGLAWWDGGVIVGGLLRYPITGVPADQDGFLAKYDSTGAFQWARTAAGPGQEFVNDTARVPGTDELVVAGQASNGTTFDTGTTLTGPATMGFIARYNGDDGGFEWVRAAGTDAVGAAAFADGSGSIVGKDGDTFVAKYGADGTQLWWRPETGTGVNQPQAASALADGSTAITGFFTDQMTFNAAENAPTTLTSAGGADIFVARTGN